MGDLRVYGDGLGGWVYDFGDKNGVECDGVVDVGNGKYGLIEVKVGGEKVIEEGGRKVVRLESKMDRDKMKCGCLKMVLSGVGKYG